jgi:signal transduction histidine kinase
MSTKTMLTPNQLSRRRRSSVARQVDSSSEREAALLGVQDECAQMRRDLHDGVLQTLYVVSLQLQTCSVLVPTSTPELSEQLQVATSQLGVAMAEIRTLLQPGRELALAYPLDLTEALRTMVHVMTRGYGVMCHVTIDPQAAARVCPDAIRDVLHMAQEALSNALRHASATTMWVTLAAIAEGWRLVVRDNGQGFKAPRRRPTGRGLQNLADRAMRVGAQLALTSSVSTGSCVEVTWVYQ